MLTAESQFTYIPDGYNLRAKIAAVAGLHGEIEFYYRPMLRSERIAAAHKMSRATDPVTQANVETVDLVSRIVRWSVPSPLTVAGFDQLPIALQEKILSVVWGTRPADELAAVSPEEIAKLTEAAEAASAKN